MSRLLIEVEAKEFDEFSKNHPLTMFEQSSHWAKLKEINGWKHHYYLYKDNDEVVGGALVLYKTFLKTFKVFYSPRGLLVDYHNEDLVKSFTNALVNEVKKEKGIYLKIDPYLDERLLDVNGEEVDGGYDNSDVKRILKEAGYKELLDKNGKAKTTSQHTIYVLDVKDKTIDEIAANLQKKTRQIINTAEKRGISIRELKRDELSLFKDLMSSTSSRKGFIDRPLAYYEEIYDQFHEDGSVKYLAAEIDFNKALEINEKEILETKEEINKLVEKKNEANGNFKKQNLLDEKTNRLEAALRKKDEWLALKDKYGDKAVASVNMDMFWGNEEIIALYGGNDTELFGFNGQYILYWEMIKKAIDDKLSRFNFYGIPETTDKNDPMHGVYEIKRCYHGRVVKLIGEFDYVVSPIKYKLYQILSDIYFKTKGN